jgi:anaerobic selenocysteine-containing dehydrogenase
MPEAVEEVVLTTCPRDCYDGCGIAVVKRDGIVQKIVGDRSHPVSRGSLCGKCALAYNGVWRDHDARLTQPLKRTGAKGSGQFEAISWGKAMSTIAEQLTTCIEEFGASSVLHTHYTGTCSLIAGAFPMRFFNRLGASEVMPDTICNNAGHVALDYVLGSSVTGFDPKTAKDSACIVVWGANPSASAPHFHKFWLKESPAKLVVIDPIKHDTAQCADIHLQLRPGTDAALAFALMHVIWNEGLLDNDFLEAHTRGWSELLPAIRDATPAWGASVCGLRVEQIIDVARLYAEGPSLLWLGQGLQRQPTGGNVMRACAALPAITANIGKPGAGIYYLNGSGPRNIDEDYVSAPQLRREPLRTVSHMGLVEELADHASSRALINWNMNVAASGPRQQALHEQLRRKDLFTVVIDLFATDTADFADIVLPAASFLEFDDLVTPYFSYYLSAQSKAEEAPGEALPNQEIFRRLSKAMGYADECLYESDADILGAVLDKSGLGIDFETLKQVGTVDPWSTPLNVFEDHCYATPSGCIELASDRAEADGYPRTAQPVFDEVVASDEYRLLSPASVWQLNDSYGNEPHIQRVLGEGTVLLNPSDARRGNFFDGQVVELYNATGALTLKVAVSDIVRAGVALSHKGRWAKLDSTRANVNVLNPGEPADMGESSAVHGTRVKIRAAP